MDGVKTMRINSTMLAVAALLLCSACANTTTKASLSGNSNVEMSSIHWDEITAGAPTRVSNGNLIFMR